MALAEVGYAIRRINILNLGANSLSGKNISNCYYCGYDYYNNYKDKNSYSFIIILSSHYFKLAYVFSLNGISSLIGHLEFQAEPDFYQSGMYVAVCSWEM